ncbi:hypothetical protein Aple_087740 [Acrocarpospora pleiomorpha]|uniref:Polysaccharide chain length determinant N-terminal domain-containing protein n=1 Tax=Acrocarpospora pleiomorpha TaxID=90975 RepID=A0A5M3XXI9_9ACTN|nr:hypothetical protein [Acrocarpospora pleiomorpha]GES25875.1 hypothetical protein Aple_087740 [Acrocarpospora pleiomorpha]
MDFWGTVLVLFRRWYVALPVLLLGVGGAGLVYTSIPPTYLSNGVIVLSIPKTGGTVPPNPKLPNPIINPLLNFDYGLNMTASILIQAMGAPEIAAELGVTPGDPTSYKVTNGSTNPESMSSGPFVFVEAESDSPEGARDMVARVLARTRVELLNRQTKVDAPRATFLTAMDVVPPTTPQPEHGSQARAAAAAAGVGALLSLWSSFALESYLVRRAIRRAVRNPGPASAKSRDAQPSGVAG